MLTSAPFESLLVGSGFGSSCLFLFEALACDFKSRSRSLRLALLSASCLCYVSLSGVPHFGSKHYLVANLAASRTAVRALLKPADVVIVSGASSSLSISDSNKVSVATSLTFSSRGDGSGVSISSLPNLLCVILSAFWERASVTPVLEILSSDCSLIVDGSSASPFGPLCGDLSLFRYVESKQLVQLSSIRSSPRNVPTLASMAEFLKALKFLYGSPKQLLILLPLCYRLLPRRHVMNKALVY